jgi:hypothetical protein
MHEAAVPQVAPDHRVHPLELAEEGPALLCLDAFVYRRAG